MKLILRTNTYNMWSIINGETTVEEAITGLAKRDYVCLTESMHNLGITAAAIKALNPNTKVYRYYTLCVKGAFESDSRNPADLSYMQMPIAKADIESNGWWLRNTDGDIIIEPDTLAYGSYNQFVDVGGTGFAAAYLAGILSRSANAGLDGFTLDYWFYKIPWGNGTSQQYETDLAWYLDAWQPFIATVTAGIKAEGYQIIGNCAGEYDSGDDGDYQKIWQRGKCHGTIYEQWAIGWTGEWLAGSVIGNRIRAFESDPLIAWTADFGLQSTDPEYARKRAVSLAMYYIALPEGRTDKRSFGYYSSGGVPWDVMWDLDIGTPAGECLIMGDLYARMYTNGVALLNYSAGDTLTFRLRGNYVDYLGTTYTGLIDVLPYTGLVLANQDDIPDPRPLRSYYLMQKGTLT